MIRARRIVTIAILFLITAVACGRPTSSIAQAPMLNGCQILPADNVWNTPIDKLPPDSHSQEYINNIGSGTPLHADFGSDKYGDFGIPYNIVPQGTDKVPVSFEYDEDSDPGPYPIPDAPKIEGGGDRHILVIEQGTCKLYETWASLPDGQGGWQAGSGAIFNLSSNTLRTNGHTSADAAGLPILPGLARYDEIAAGAINHALRFTAPCSATFYIWPARHKAVPDDCPDLPPAGTRVPPFGLRFRLRASFNTSGFSHDTQVILNALKKYGMFLADNGSSWYISGAPDQRWDDDTLVDELKQVHGSDFEAVDETSLQIGPDSGQARQPIADSISVSTGGARQGQPATYTIAIAGDGTAISMTNQLPATLTLSAGPSTTPASAPPASYDPGTRRVLWSGSPGNLLVKVSYTATINTAVRGPILNTAVITRGGSQQSFTATLISNPLQRFLAIVSR